MNPQEGASIEVRLLRIEALLATFVSGARPAQEYYSVKEAANVVGVSPDHIRRALAGGRLACSNIGTNGRPLYRIYRTDLAAWVERCKGGADPRPTRRRDIIPPSRHHRQPPARSAARDP